MVGRANFKNSPRINDEQNQDCVLSHLVSYLDLSNKKEFEYALSCFLDSEEEGYCHDAAERIHDRWVEKEQDDLAQKFYQTIPDDKLDWKQVFGKHLQEKSKNLK
jgi:hypothetical protein